MASSLIQTLNISLPTGPLGVGIQLGSDRNCIVSYCNSNSTPLEMGDIIVSLNGIRLVEVEGGMAAWVKLFQAFGTSDRNLVVQRAVLNNNIVEDSMKHSASSSSSTNKKQKMQDDSNKFGIASSSTKSSNGMEVISLLDDTDDEGEGSKNGNNNVVATAAKMQGGNAFGGDTNKKKMSAKNTSQLEPEVMEVSTASSSSMTSSSSRQARGDLKDDNEYNNSTSGEGGDDDDDEELTIVATKGQNALADFPHSRENCVTHPFSGDKQKHCSNCYCYVCDKPANDCKTWSSHCLATHNDPRWRAERERAKRQLVAVTAPITSASSSTAASRSSTMTFSFGPTTSSSRSSSSNARRSANFSVSKLLQQVTTVHPVEMQPPAGRGFNTALRHYQKQSLAFMVETERNHNRGGWLSDEVGMGKSAVVLALVATNPASPKSIATNAQIQAAMNDYDQNLRRRMEIEASYNNRIMRMSEAHYQNSHDGMDPNELKKQGREFQMLKLSEKQKRDAQLKSTIQPVRRVKIKTTVILTSVSLLGQWEDEVKKHAPGLVVRSFHNSRKKRNDMTITLSHHASDRRAVANLNAVDVIISTSTSMWPSVVTDCFQFHRVVQDESHLFIKNGASARIEYANLINSSLRWGVTATPATNSANDLNKQLSFVVGTDAISYAPNTSSAFRSAVSSFCLTPTQDTFNSLVNLLKTYMVRHTKSQRINGNEALALPPSTTSTIMLTMSADEDRAFNKISTKASTFAKHLETGAKKFTAEKSFLPQMNKVVDSPEVRGDLSELVTASRRRYIPERLTKIVALRQDLAACRARESKLRAVVFTQHLEVHDACVRGLQRDGFDVYQFSGSSNASKRDSAIRSFQNTTNGRPAVFVITLRSGNVGITLTAASRVYLLEPALDPAIEVQAAGRIHRLGQDKPCHVVKFVFRNSYEANTLVLHEHIRTGKITLVDGYVPSEAMKILARNIRF